MKGGVGKTTLAINFADCLRRAHNKKVALIDIDPQFNATQCLIPVPDYIGHLKSSGDTIINLFDNSPSPQVSVLSGAGTAEKKDISEIKLLNMDGLSILPGNIDLYRVEMISGEGREFILKRFIEAVLLPNEYDYVIIDTPPTPSIWMTSALIASDYYVIPVKPDPLSIIGIDLLKTIINRRSDAFGLSISCLGVVFTMIDRPDSKNLRETKAALNRSALWKKHIINATLPKRTNYARNQLGKPFALTSDDFELRESIMKITNEVIARITK